MKFENRIFLRYSFYSKDNITDLKVYYDYFNHSITNNLNHYITTDNYNKYGDNYKFYFYLPIHNYTKSFLEHKFLLFRPESEGIKENINIKIISIIPQKIALNGTLNITKEDKSNTGYYLTITNLEKGEEIYLEFIIDNFNYSFYIDYKFSNEYNKENYFNFEYLTEVKNKKTENNVTTYYYTIPIKYKAKFLIFNYLQNINNIIIKNREYNPIYDNIIPKHQAFDEKNNTAETLMIVIIVIGIIIMLIIPLVFFILMKRKNKVNNTDIENASSENV